MKNKLQRLLLMGSKFTLYGLVLQLFFMASLLANESAAQNSKSVKDVKLDLYCDGKSILDVFRIIEQKTQFVFFYETKHIDKNLKLNFHSNEISVSDVLLKISMNSDLKFKQINNRINVTTKDSKSKDDSDVIVIIQTKRITGKVTSSEDKEPLPGVNVVEKGTSNGTITDVNGMYSFEVTEGATLVFSSVGYTSEEVAIGSRSVIDLILVPDIKQLQELVVVGYGTQRKGELTVAVSQVKAEELQSIPKASLLETLGGRAAGVDVVSASGAPGSQTTIRIRGANSVNSSAAPLYVVDGFPVASNMGDLSETSRMSIKGNDIDLMSMINPNDIESIEILKDGAATSIYGSRGANGVILITTKSGRQGKSEISANIQTGIQTIAKQWELMNANEFSNLLYDAYSRGGINMANSAFDPANKLAIPTTYNTDWLDQIFQQGYIQDYSISFSGAGENTNYSGSVGYLDNKGIIKSNYLKRYSARLNGESKAWQQRLTFGANMNVSYVDQKTISDDRVYDQAMQMAPNYPVRYPEGTEYAGYYTHANQVIDAMDILWGNNYGVSSSSALRLENPYYDIDVAKAPSNVARMLLNGYISLEPVKGLVFKSSVGTDLNYSKMKYLILSEGPYRPTGGSVEHKQNQNYSWLIENTIAYNKSFGDHSLTFLLGQSGQKYYREGLGIAVEENEPGKILVGNNPYFVDGWWFNNGVHDHLTDNHKYARVDNWAVASYFGRLNYSYDSRYLLTATLRRDGSSKFGNNNKWGNFPGVSVAWNAHNESFFNVPFVNQLKVRGSWAIVGNGNIGNYNSQALLVSRPSTPIGVVVAGTSVYEKGLVDKGLSWESTRTTNFGFDAFIFNRFSITSDIFWKKTYDLLYASALPESTGFSSISVTNLGSIKQFGVELSISADVINKNKFNWYATLNLDHMRGKITDLPVNTDWVGDYIRSYINEPIGIIYGYKVAGIYNTEAELQDEANPYSNAQLGDYKYLDLGSTNEFGKFVNVPDTNITAADRVNLGNVNPKINFGFNNTFTYGSFDLNLFFRSSLGNKIYNSAKRALLDADGGRNLIKDAVNRWTPENHNQFIQAANSNRKDPTGGAAFSNNRPNGGVPISTFIENGSYLRLANVSLGYQLPQNALKSLGLQSVRIYTTINNAFVITKYSGLDPEIGGGDLLVPRGIDNSAYPKTRTYSLGLNVQF